MAQTPGTLREQAIREDAEDSLDISHPEDAKQPLQSNLESIAHSRLALVIGHSARNSGAYAVSPIDNTEYYWNTQLALAVLSFAGVNGVDCGIFFRDGIGVHGAYRQVKEWGAGTCIELHFNSFNSRVSGTETLHGEYDKSKELAALVHREILKIYDRPKRKDRGIRKRVPGERGGRSLSQLTHIPSIIVEPFFGDVSTEAQLGMSHFDDYAQALVKAHAAFNRSSAAAFA